jgi:hypothetical protein
MASMSVLCRRTWTGRNPCRRLLRRRRARLAPAEGTALAPGGVVTSHVASAPGAEAEAGSSGAESGGVLTVGNLALVSEFCVSSMPTGRPAYLCPMMPAAITGTGRGDHRHRPVAARPMPPCDSPLGAPSVPSAIATYNAASPGKGEIII